MLKAALDEPARDRSFVQRAASRRLTSRLSRTAASSNGRRDIIRQGQGHFLGDSCRRKKRIALSGILSLGRDEKRSTEHCIDGGRPDRDDGGYQTRRDLDQDRAPMISTHPPPVPCQWFSRLASPSTSGGWVRAQRCTSHLAVLGRCESRGLSTSHRTARGGLKIAQVELIDGSSCRPCRSAGAAASA
jgi:hypothetical protein